MTSPNAGSTNAGTVDQHPTEQSFHDLVVDGLAADPKTLPCKYFYDRRGSELFDQICDLDEYYVTRAELQIMQRHAAAMADQIDSGVRLVEYGSGSSIKTRLLLDQLHSPAAYVPVDISKQHLLATADELTSAYPHIEVLPVCADFTRPFSLPTPAQIPTHTAVYFPGSTIGNFQPNAATQLLKGVAKMVGTGGGLLIGIDLQKPIDILEAAYDDASGVTAEFNLNLLHRINRELDATINAQQFHHEAKYDPDLGRIEMRLISRVDQSIRIGDSDIAIDAGEAIITEHSHKYTIDGFAKMATDAGFELHQSWTDDDHQFAVLHLVVAD